MNQKMYKPVKAVVLTTVLALLFCLSACSGSDGKVSPSDKGGNNQKDLYSDNGETFCRGVWAADNGDTLTGYYVFYDSANGRFDETQYGMSVPYSVSAKKKGVEFNLGAADFSDPAAVEITGKGKRTLTWTKENRVEYLTLLGDKEPDTFSFFSEKDLSDMALDFYEAQNGSRPESAAVSVKPDCSASITLSGQKGSVIAEYEVDVFTGKGRVTGSDEEIQLIRMTTDD